MPSFFAFSLNCFLSILESLEAAEIFPFALSRTFWKYFLSNSFFASLNGLSESLVLRGFLCSLSIRVGTSHSSTVGGVARMTAWVTMFSNSRTLPGQLYLKNFSITSEENHTKSLENSVHAISRKY